MNIAEKKYIEDTLCKAIHEKKVVRFCYKGLDKIVTVEPFLLGEHTKTKKVILRAYLLKGYSKSKNNNDWRKYDIAFIEKLEILQNTFSNERNGYNPNEDNISIICNVPKFGFI